MRVLLPLLLLPAVCRPGPAVESYRVAHVVDANPSASAEGPSSRDTLLFQAASQEDWQLPPIDQVREGRLAIIHDQDGPRIELRKILQRGPEPPSLSGKGAIPSFSGNSLIVSDFSRSNRTPLGGYFGVFQKAPSVGRAYLVPSADLGPPAELRPSAGRRRGLTLDCRHRAPGFCGAWVQLFDFELPPRERTFLDIRGFSTLTFWIRGGSGGERLLFKLADAVWEQREDALPVGEVSEFLPSGRIEPVWQQAVVPLDRVPGRLDRNQLALVVFEVMDPGTTEVEIGPVAFSRAPAPLPEWEPLPDEGSAEDPPHKATWIWHTAELMETPDQWEELVDFLARDGFDRVFLQLPGDSDQRGLPGEIPIEAEALRPLVASLSARGMKVYALDGAPFYVRPEFHAGVLRTIENVARYNRTAEAHERFFGVRFDIEPYLLPGFHGPNRSELLTDLLQLTAASVDLAHEHGLVYGADIPFWYDAPAEKTFERVRVEFSGREKPVSEHILDLVDDVSIMDYRTEAHGADGTIRHGGGEIGYAEQIGKSIFIGLETFPVPDEVLVDFGGDPRRGLPSTPAGSGLVALAQARDSVHMALVSDPPDPDATRAALEGWLHQIQVPPEDVFWWPVGRRVEVPAQKISFADLDPAQFEEVLRATAEEFRAYGSFAGFAIHHALSYRRLLGR